MDVSCERLSLNVLHFTIKRYYMHAFSFVCYKNVLAFSAQFATGSLVRVKYDCPGVLYNKEVMDINTCVPLNS